MNNTERAISMMGQGMGWLIIATLMITIVLIYSQTGELADYFETTWIIGALLTTGVNYVIFQQIRIEYNDIQERKEEMNPWEK